MKKYICSLLGLFIWYIGFGQSIPITGIDNLIPTKEQIYEQRKAWIEERVRDNMPIVRAKNGIELTEPLIETSVPLVYLRIEMDSLNNLLVEPQSDRILLWNTPDITWCWDNQRPIFGKFNLYVAGNSDQRLKYIAPYITNILPQEYIFVAYFLPQERYLYPYIIYQSEGNRVICDLNGKLYNSLDEVIEHQYDGFENYRTLYKIATSSEYGKYFATIQEKEGEYAIRYIIGVDFDMKERKVEYTYWDTISKILLDK